MKNFFILSMLTASTFLSGCATGNGLVLDTVGPVQAQTSTVNSTDGTLVVYSAYEANADFASRDPDQPECSDYKIFTADGKLVKRVHNVTDDILQNPVPVNLPEGKYRIIACANGYGYVTVPIIIEAQKSTILHLEGGGDWPDESAFNQTNAVRLPDGNIIGWKSASSL